MGSWQAPCAGAKREERMGCSGSLPPEATDAVALHKRGQQAVAGQNAGELGEKDCRQWLLPEIGGYGFYFTAAHCSQLFASAQTADPKNPKLSYWRFFWRGSRQTQLHLPTMRVTTRSQEATGRFLYDILMNAIDAASMVWRSQAMSIPGSTCLTVASASSAEAAIAAFRAPDSMAARMEGCISTAGRQAGTATVPALARARRSGA